MIVNYSTEYTISPQKATLARTVTKIQFTESMTNDYKGKMLVNVVRQELHMKATHSKPFSVAYKQVKQAMQKFNSTLKAFEQFNFFPLLKK